MRPVVSRTTVALIGGVVLGVAASMTGPVLAELQDESPTSLRADGIKRTAVAADARLAAPELPSADVRRLAEILARVRNEYVADVSPHQLMENAVRGMVSGLDPYSAYLDRNQYEEMRLNTSGSYPGIGVEVAATDHGIQVLRPLEDSPAARAGIRGGDIIVRVDGEPVGDDVDAAIDQMRGPAGSLVKLSVRRSGAATNIVDLALQRAQVDVHSATGRLLEPGFGYLRISTFSDTTPDDVERVLAAVSAVNAAPLRGLIIDLRNNPGGVLEAAVDVADAFLETGVIVTAEGRTADARFRMNAHPGDVLRGARIALLVNGGSASAAEILAGALKDHGRAVLIGRRTYGKGSVQTVIPLAEGRALKLTTSHYATPSGEMIDERGIEPDIALDGPDEVAEDATNDREVRTALDALKTARRGNIVRG